MAIGDALAFRNALFLVVLAATSIAGPTDAFRSIAHSSDRHRPIRTTKSCLWWDHTTKEKEDEDEAQCHRQKMSTVDRRECMHRLLSSSIFGAVGLRTRSAVAAEEESSEEEQQRMVFDRRPIAPTGALLPATEQRMLLKECFVLSEKLNVGKVASAAARAEDDDAIQRLHSILVNPNDAGSGGYNYYTKGLTEKKRGERDRRILSQYQQSPERHLSGNIIRATMNIYVSNLRYGKDYTVQDPEWKSAYIRENDGLPDYRRLIQADLDLRILYMNQVQIRVDDAAAEFYAAFGSSNDGSSRDDSDGDSVAELQRLLRSAMDSMDSWFELIGDADADEASWAVAAGKSLKMVDHSYAAGFVPPSRE